MNTSDKMIIECECGSHLLRTDYDEEKELFSMSFYTYGNGNLKINIWSRIRYAFIHVFTGRVYSDQMYLNKKEALKLIEFLKEKSEDNPL